MNIHIVAGRDFSFNMPTDSQAVIINQTMARQLGLLGLPAFMAEQRTKEVGIRKVLGASVRNVVVLLSKDFLKLVVIAIVIASPLAWYAMNLWLENFAYHINIEWWVFMMAGLIAIAIALLTVSFQSVKAALINPVQSLRAE